MNKLNKLCFARDRYLKLSEIEKLMQDFKIKQELAESIIYSAALFDLYIKIKGKSECSLIDFENKNELLEFIIDNSQSLNTYNSFFISNKRSLLRKINEYKNQSSKDYYKGLCSLVPIKKSNLNTRNAKKITDEQALFLHQIWLLDTKRCKNEIYNELKLNYPDLKNSKQSIKGILRKFEIQKFKFEHDV
ncbi:hypothetical protein BWK58_08625 [Flavobacterium columnare]|nr:hypothetical protein BWK58_08625 [Flavobacterium columnare]